MQRVFGDALMSAGALLLLLLMLAAFDGRVRDQISRRVNAGKPSAQIATAGATVRDVASVVFTAARDQSIEHAPLVIFALAGTVLLVFMLRT